jgi:uncharacterized phage protein (TIGR02218 family)
LILCRSFRCADGLDGERRPRDAQRLRSVRGATKWAYCNADRFITHQGQTYAPISISDDGVRITGETTADVLKVTGPASLAVAQLFRVVAPSAEIELVVRDFHFGETDASSSSQVAWVGSISGVGWPQVDRCAIACESLGASLDRPGLHLTYQVDCPHTLFDRNCRVDRSPWAVPATLTAVTALTVTCATFAAQPDGHFSGGYVEWPIGDGELDSRTVETHVGGVLTLMGGSYGLAVGQAVTAYPGCRQTRAYCNSKFNNLPNHGGFDLPGKSPFDGDPVM